MVAERKERTDFFTMPSLELVRTGEKLARDEEIDLEKVETEFAIVDDSHANDLKQSMAQERGQISPIVVRAKFVEGQIHYDVIDGFHRAEGMRRLGKNTISARVLYGCDDEELFDQRILAASSVKAVQFPRIAAWINNSFSETAWSKKGLTATQALGITVSDSESSRQGLTVEEVSELKEWVRKKCGQWGRTPGDTYRILRIVSKSNPELVKEVRTSGGGKDRQARITPERLAAIALSLPGEEYFEAQAAIMDYVLENRLYAEETKQLVLRIAPLIKPNMDKRTVAEIIEQTIASSDDSQNNHDEGMQWAEDFDEMEEPTEEELITIENAGLGSDDQDEDKLAKLLGLTMDELPTPRLDSESKADDDLSTSGVLRKKPKYYIAGRENDRNFMGPSPESLAEMRSRIVELEDMLREARNGHGQNDGLFWKTAEYLTTQERQVMKLVFEDFKDIEIIANYLGIPQPRVYQLIVSSFAKHTIAERPKHEPKDGPTGKPQQGNIT